jgi:serpin B
MLKSLTRVLVLSGVVTLTTAMGSIEGTPGDLLAAEPGKAPTKLVVQANSDFAFDLYQQLAQENDGKNLFFSPYSISSALAMTAEGARGETAEEMGAVLRFPDQMRRVGGDAQLIPWETSKIHTGMAAINNRLNRDMTPYELTVANALWGEKTFPFRPQFVKALDEPYSAALIPADFIGNAEGERQRINQWVEEKTDERIKDLLPEGILDSLTRLVLTNAIYFKGNWSQPFNEKSTRELPFTSADGRKVGTSMMHHNPKGVKHERGKKNDWPFGYAALDNLQILEMPYAGKELSMFVLLPSKHDGLPALEKQLSREKLDAWLGAVKPQEVDVWMPKFKMETEFALKPTLQAMGMPSAFEPGGFTGISDSSEARQLYISAVQHKAFVEVNEKGTEAAAATAVVVSAKSRPRYPTFAATRPFIFLIRDNETDSILFLGRMMNPTTE